MAIGNIINIMALASDIRATKKTAQALYCLYDKEEKRKTNKFQEWKKDFNEADYTYLYRTTSSCLTIRMSQNR